MLLQDVAAQTDLIHRLERLALVSQHSSDGETEGERLGTSLAHLEESFSTYLTKLLPKLVAAADDQELADALFDIGDELRHIAWHMRDPKYFEIFIQDVGVT